MRSTVRSRVTHASATTLTLIGILGVAGLLGGCSGRVITPSFSTPVTPSTHVQARYPADGVELTVPRNWSETAGTAPMVSVFSSGPAVIALWRYPSSHGAITSTSELRAALNALVPAARVVDPTLAVQRTAITRVDGDGAVIIDGLEQVDGHPRRVRSEHVYVNGAEIVLDAYAPAALFPSVDHRVFSPVRKSLTLINGGVPKG